MQSVYYNNLGVNRRTYDAALQCFQNRGKSFPVAGSLQATELVAEVLNDHPEIFYVGQEFKIMSSLMRRDILPCYLYSHAETVQLKSQLDLAAETIIGNSINDHQSDYDKVRSLHDYLKSNLEYDTAAASSRTPNERNIAQAHNIVGALLNNKCVCEGFAKAFKFLCDKIGLECWVVSGKGSSSIGAGPHAWNIVRINGYYHHVDVTWDNQFSDSSAMPNYGYMNLSDDEIAKDHTWNRKNYPVCSDSPYNYFRVNNALLDSKAQLESMLYNSIQMEEEIIMFRVVRGSILEREINGCLPDSVQRAANRCKHVALSTFRYGGVPEQLTFFIQAEYAYK
ncbi:MAG: hypothetical protein LUG52_02900 [Clostridia bacterium]|nr:hypothetical protein [Clostridia bacterium]